LANIRLLNEGDIDSILDITNKEDWGYTRRDFENALHIEPKGCFVAIDGDEIIGLTTTINYGKMGWIGNVVVSEDRRGKGIGRMLVVHAAGYLKARGVRAVKLNSYLEHVRFYKRMGFEEEGRCVVFTHQGALGISARDRAIEGKAKIRKMKDKDLDEVLSLDKSTFGSDRMRVLRRTFEDNPGLCHVASNEENAIVGFTMGIGSSEVAEVGPWVCASGIDEEASGALLAATARDSGARAVLLVVPCGNDGSTSLLDGMGFKREFEAATMRLGEPVDYGQPDGIFALGSLAHG
jgi:ribosomal protein S18 acetylase RimI-like enzyme